MEGWEVVSELLKMALPAVGAFLVYEIRQMRKSVEDLNVHVAVILKEIEYHEHRITKLEDLRA